MKHIIFLFFVLLFIGCAPQNETQINTKLVVEPQKIYNSYKKIDNKPEELQDLYVSYLADEKRNEVLNLMNLSLYAYQKGYYNDAKLAFDKVLLNIESTYSEDESSEKAKSLWYGEDEKRFIGEPYERSMAYFYRGLLYLKDKDYENARASFKGGLLQDARSEDNQHQSDFKTLLLLEALSSRLNNDEELYNESLNELSNVSSSNSNLLDEFNTYKIYSINSEKLDIREKANDGSIVVGSYSRNEFIKVLKVDDEWAQTDKGWISSYFIEEKIMNRSKKLYSIIPEKLDIRKDPSKEAEVLDTYLKGELININAEKEDWIQTKKGWIATGFLKEESIETFSTTKPLKKEHKSIIDIVKDSNFFLLIDTGFTPQKYSAGKYESELKFRENGYLKKPNIQVKNLDPKLILLDDIYFQASTRGGREIDKIIEGKATFKSETMETAEEAKNTAKGSFLAAGSMLSLPSTGDSTADGVVAVVGLTFAAIGLVATTVGGISEQIANAVVSKADTRYWENLPGGIYLYMDKLKPGKYEINLESVNSKTINIEIPDNKQIVVEHTFDKIVKPQGIINMYQINDVITEKDKYHNNYLETKKETTNENFKNKIVNFFNNK